MILNVDKIDNIYITNTPVDMRKSIDGLSSIIYHQFNMNLLDNSLYVFMNRNRTVIKMIYYEHSGFWLLMKRLEKGRFQYMFGDDIKASTITPNQLIWLVEGLNMHKLDNINNGLSTTFI